MNRPIQSCLLFAIGLHGIVLFGIPLPERAPVVTAEPPHVEVKLVEVRPEIVEPAPPAPEPAPIKAEIPAPVEPPKEIPPSQPEPEPIKALPVKEPVVAPKEAEFQVAATTNPVVSLPSEIPLSPPVTNDVPIPRIIKAQARYRHNPEPDYPVQARRRRQEGRVLLTVILDQSGTPIKIEVKESSNSTLLDTAAASAVSQWEFEPATFNGKPVASEVEVPVRFTLSK
jgi:periplasmic protein TonB